MAGDVPIEQSLTPFYAGWEVYNRLLVEAVTPLTPDQLTLRVAPHERSIVEIAAHIVAARAWWFHGIMHAWNAEAEEFYSWDDEHPPTLKAAQLEIGLESTWRLISASLAQWTPADLGATFSTRHGERTRQWIIWHVIEHDLHHGGELSLTLGTHGLRAPDL